MIWLDNLGLDKLSMADKTRIRLAWARCPSRHAWMTVYKFVCLGAILPVQMIPCVVGLPYCINDGLPKYLSVCLDTTLSAQMPACPCRCL